MDEHHIRLLLQHGLQLVFGLVFAFVESRRGAMRLAALSPRAVQAGLVPDMALADARGLVPSVLAALMAYSRQRPPAIAAHESRAQDAVRAATRGGHAAIELLVAARRRVRHKQQRTAVARAVVCNPELVLADDTPT